MIRSAVAALVLAGCATGAPSWFSPGNTWTLPLVDPLSGGTLVTPVWVDGKGPYLFAIDPDGPCIVDAEVLLRGGIPANDEGLRMRGWDDTSRRTRSATLPSVRIGDLTIGPLPVEMREEHTFDAQGRRIYGVLGHSVFPISVVFGIDRDRGIAWMSTQEAFHPPPGAQVLPFDTVHIDPGHVPFRFVHATIDGDRVDLYVELGRTPSRLVTKQWAAASLRAIESDLVLTDPAGVRHPVQQLGIAQHVTAGPVARDRLAFAPYVDRRFYEDQISGALGLEFFDAYAMVGDWQHERFYLTPRQPAQLSRSVRLARWGQAVCPDASCVHVTTSEDQGTILHVTREGDGELEVVLAATGTGRSALPALEVNFPAGSTTLEARLDSRYEGAKIDIADVSPFPRSCPGGNSCVMTEPAPAP